MYVPDEDEWVCEHCGWPAPARLARLFRLPRLRIRARPELEQELLDDELDELELPARFDADELGLDTEDEDECLD